MIIGLLQFAAEMTKERKNRYLVVLADGETMVEATAYLDTGNFLREPKSGKGVQIVTERIWNLFAKGDHEIAVIPYHTVGNPYGEMTGIMIECMEICGMKSEKGGERLKIMEPWIAKAPYGLTKDNSYEVLLHTDTLEGGITSGD